MSFKNKGSKKTTSSKKSAQEPKKKFSCHYLYRKFAVKSLYNHYVCIYINKPKKKKPKKETGNK